MDEASDVIDAIFGTVGDLEVPAADLGSFLLPGSDPYVKGELQRRQEACRGATDRLDYQVKHKDFLASKGISWARLQVPAETKASPWYQVLPQREREVLAYAIAAHPELVSVDCSQRIDRASIGRGPRLPTITPGGKVYLMVSMAEKGSKVSGPCNRLLLGLEALKLQGFPTNLLPHAEPHVLPSDPQLMDLAGNAFPGTVLSAIFLALYLHLPPVSRVEKGAAREEVTAEEVLDLLSI